MSEENVVPFAAGINKLADKIQQQAVDELQELLEDAIVQLDDLEETAAGLFSESGTLKIMSVFDRIGLEGHTDVDTTPFQIAVGDLLQESRNLVDEMLDIVQEYKHGDSDDTDNDSGDSPVVDSGDSDNEPTGSDGGDDDDDSGNEPKDHTNRGHGNNTDGIDNDNPGKGTGGPNAGKDTNTPDRTEGDLGNQGDSTPGASQAVLDQLVNPPSGGDV